MNRYNPLKELMLTRLREFIREPEIVFWVYGFPLLLTIGLGIAFRSRPAERIFVDVERNGDEQRVIQALSGNHELVVLAHPADTCRERLRLGKSSIVVVPGRPTTFLFDPTRPESALARKQVDDYLQRAAGRADPVPTSDRLMTEPGARYIDFLVPGLLGMNLMSGGLWGVGFVIVDMRMKKLLKRLVSTPMRRWQYLCSMIGGRLVFMVPELIVILGSGALLFQISIRGNWLAIACISLLGTLAFSGIGLLAACRARRLETISGLVNLIMLPMWLLSGIFFSPERFPELLQPVIQVLPLTQLNNALRAVVLEGASFASQAIPLLALGLWGAASFGCALRWFRWN